jgi:hypothetical protein
MAETSYTVTRTTPRFTFIAEAEVIGMGNPARVTELSARGCYIDTMSPLPRNTTLTVRIRYGCSSCDFPGKIIYTHAGFGMGLVFGELDAKQQTTLNVWLDELARKLD